MGIGAELLEDLMINELVREQEFSYLAKQGVWVTQLGNHIKFKDMGINHIINTINWLKRNEYYPSQEQFLEGLVKEAKQRGYVF